MLSPVIRRRLETQGFACSDDLQFLRLVPWLRFTYAACTVLIAVGTGLGLTPLLWALVAVAALGAIFPVHPFDLLYNHGVRYLPGTVPLPRSGGPRRFACGVAAVWAAGTAVAFGVAIAWLGYALGGVLTAVGLLVSVTHFCIPSTVYQLLFGRRGREVLLGQLR